MLGEETAEVPACLSEAEAVADLAGDGEALLVELDVAAGVAQVGVGVAEVAQVGVFGAAVADLIWLIIFVVWRYVSLASILASLAFPLCYLLFALPRRWDPLGQRLLLVFPVLVAALVTLRHHTNIAGLMAGTEHQFKSTRPPSATRVQ
ncbi:MAG: glycerol-3-phosphate acyltransferase [Planctomycetota bacterium]|nr:glycerol-3-phosphate acyltransferase [Planctomycetota bacterium]